MTDRRGTERHQLLFNATVHAADTGRELGYLANIGEDGGLMVVGEHPLEVGSTHRVRIPLPAEWQGREALVADTEVVWTEPAVFPGMHRNGLRPLDLDPQQQETVAELSRAFSLDFQE